MIQSISAEPTAVTTDSVTTVTVLATDADGDALEYGWSAIAGSFPGGTTASQVQWQAPAAAGTYTLEVEVSDGNERVTGTLEIEVTEQAPSLSVTPGALNFGESTSMLRLVVANAGGDTLSWDVAADRPWMTVDPPSGISSTAADTVVVSVDRSGMTPFSYAGQLDVISNGGAASVAVRMIVPGTPVYDYEIINTFPHDSLAFTQGLAFANGSLYEGTGIQGHSTLRRVNLETGEVLQIVHLSESYFGEGITVFENRILQLTWRAHRGIIYDIDSLAVEGYFDYLTQGWGITHDGERLIMSDGSSMLYFLDPETFARVGTLKVTDEGDPVERLNELEYVRGEIYANVWQSDRIARISPETGRVVGWIDLTGLISLRTDVLNGIAYDVDHDRLFVTGKLWPRLFEIEPVPPGGRPMR